MSDDASRVTLMMRALARCDTELLGYQGRYLQVAQILAARVLQVE
jgi:hypothetical protein